MVYMGGRTAPKLASTLIAEGLDANTPAVIVESITRPEQAKHTLTLEDLMKQSRAYSGPVLIGIGQVFAKAMAMKTNTETPAQALA